MCMIFNSLPVLMVAAGVSSWQVCCLSLQHHMPVLPARLLQLLLGSSDVQDLPAGHICRVCGIAVLRHLQVW